MRHERIAAHSGLTEADVAAVWPISPQVAPLPIAEIEQLAEPDTNRSTPAAPDVPGCGRRADRRGLCRADRRPLHRRCGIARVRVRDHDLRALHRHVLHRPPADVSRRSGQEHPAELGAIHARRNGHADRPQQRHGRAGADALVPALLTIGVLIMAIAAAYYM